MFRGVTVERRRRRVTSLVVTGLLVATLSSCSTASRPATPPKALKRSAVSRIVVIVLENHEYDAITGRASAPYINALAAQSAIAANYHAVSHPSLPNYLALTGGSTFGFDGSDCMTCSVSQRNLIDELEATGISWKAYMQGLPTVCSFKASSG